MEMTEKTTGSGSARWGFYLMGLLILAMGLTLNTKAGLGVSPIISLSYAASVIWNRNFGDMTFVLISISISIVVLLFDRPLLQIFNITGESLRRAKEHLDILMFFIWTSTITNITCGFRMD